MADVKWIKITTDIFDDEKILLIESLPDSYAIITVWFKLLCLAGKQNNSGVFMMGKIAYTDKMLATIFRMKESTVTMALNTFEHFDMVEIIDGVITIPNWGKHQNLEQLEERRKYQREYQKEYRKKQKLLTAAESEDSKCLHKHLHESNVNSLEEELEEELELDIRERENTDYKSLVDLYHSICKSFPSVRSLSEARKKAIKARLNTYSLEDFKTVFENAENSAFLKGNNDRNWSANFDWLIADKNFVKVLEGNYADKPKYGRKEPVPGWMAKERKLDDDELEYIKRTLNENIDEEELKRLEAEQEKELAARAERLKKILRE
jgi:predicted phage replisome organizer